MERNVDEATDDAGERWEVIGRGAEYSIIEGDEFNGVRAAKDPRRGEIVALSTRNSSESSRWRTMPSMDRFPHLKELDLHKSRYILHMDESVCNLSNLVTLILTRCERLLSLPEDIGKLRNLREVGLIVS